MLRIECYDSTATSPIRTEWIHDLPENWTPATKKEVPEGLLKAYKEWMNPKAVKERKESLSRVSKLTKSSEKPDPVRAERARKHKELTLRVDKQYNPIGANHSYSAFGKDYPAYAEYVKSGLDSERRAFTMAETPFHEYSEAEQLRWLELSHLQDMTTFWPDDAAVRALVTELDLDPYISQFCNLYEDKQNIVFPVAELRKQVITLLNKGRIILDIDRLSDEDTCASYEQDAKFYSIHHGIRRKLPVV